LVSQDFGGVKMIKAVILSLFLTMELFAHQVKLTWNPVATYNNGMPITQAVIYEVWRSTLPNLNNSVKLGESVVPSYSDSTTVPSQNYYYFVRAYVLQNKVKLVSGKSNVFKIKA
jgi:hypothetical protein